MRELQVAIPKGAFVHVKRPYQWREKEALRAKVQEHTHRYTALIRADIQRRWREGWRIGNLGWFLPGPSEIIKGEEIDPQYLEVLQPAIEEYDPVVELALIAVDYRNEPNLRRLANSDAAPYLRPKFSPIREDDADAPGDEAPNTKLALLQRLVGVVDLITTNKVRGEPMIDVTPGDHDSQAVPEAGEPSPGQPRTNGNGKDHDDDHPES